MAEEDVLDVGEYGRGESELDWEIRIDGRIEHIDSGFSFPKSRANIDVAVKSIHRFKKRVREITGRSRGISMDRRLGDRRGSFDGLSD